MMLSVPCQALLYFPTVNKDKQADGHHQSGCKGKTFWLLLRLFNKDIPSIPQEYLCQKAPKRLSLDDLPNIPPPLSPDQFGKGKSIETALPGLSGEPIIPAPTKKVQKAREP